MSCKRDVLLLVGRILLSALFIYTGYTKLSDISGTTAALTSLGLAGATWKAVVVGLVELGGGLLLLLGGCVHIGALILAIWLGVVTVMMHFPSAPLADTIQTLKNTGLLGAMLIVMAAGGGKYQVYRCKCDEKM